MAFPDRFTWGAAAASYQIEGAPYRTGGGLSVWDMFCRIPGKVWNGHTGDTACDHVNRFREDVKLMKELGIHSYRLSVSWPRVIPDGTGAVSEEGIDFYDRLVDELVGAGIAPAVTLFHWDFPYELFCKGGWLNRESADWFADYAAVVVERLSDRVGLWITHNEPSIFVALGHGIGTHAPGMEYGFHEILRVMHHVLLAHGKACTAVRGHAKQDVRLGWTHAWGPGIPATDSEEDIAAARKYSFSVPEERTSAIGFNSAWWNDPVYLGRYPEEGVELHGECLPDGWEADMETIRQPVDFWGANTYRGDIVRAGGPKGFELLPDPTGTPRNALKWPLTPGALRWGSRFAWERYEKPIWIFENGMCNQDWVAVDGGVHDAQRIDMVKRYLREFEKCVDDGVPIEGYYLWSIMDNFEWAEGYKERFGTIHVDYETLERTPKDSYHWYKQVIASNGAHIHED